MKLDEKFDMAREMYFDLGVGGFLRKLKGKPIPAEVYCAYKDKLRGRHIWTGAVLKFNPAKCMAEGKGCPDFYIGDFSKLLDETVEEKIVKFYAEDPEGGLRCGDCECTEIGFFIKLRKCFEALGLK